MLEKTGQKLTSQEIIDIAENHRWYCECEVCDDYWELVEAQGDSHAFESEEFDMEMEIEYRDLM